jgi:hypothetical protein
MTTPPTRVAATSLLSVPLGRSSQQIQLSLIPFPKASANPADKARAFDFCRQSLEANKHKFEFNEFTAFLALHILAHVMPPSIKSPELVRPNLHGEGFLYSDGNQVDEADFSLPPKERPANISLFSVGVAVKPTAYAPEGVSIMNTPAMHLTFCLTLPQDTVYTATGRNMLADFGTPKKTRTLEEFAIDELGNNDWSAVGLPNGTNLLEDYDLDALVRMPGNKRKALVQRSAASKAKPVSSMLHQSPRLAGVFTRSDTTVTTYTGDYDFMNDQGSFDKTFPSRTFAGPNAATHTSATHKFIDLCMLETLFQLLRIDYVGNLSPSVTSSTIGLTAALRSLKMRAPGDLTSSDPSNPDDLFQDFADIATQVNDNTSSWGLTLAHQFHAALPIEYRNNIEANDANHYQLPDPATSTTKAKQLAALCTLRWVAVDAKKRLETLFKQQTAFMVTYLKNTGKKPSSFSAPTQAKAVTFTSDTAGGTDNIRTATSSFASPAEGVIRQHSSSDLTPPTPTKLSRADYIPAMPPVTVMVGGKAFPVCQSTGFQSAFDVTFRGCLGCGQMDHNVFKDCPLKDDPTVQRDFFSNLHAHKPQYRVEYERAVELRKQQSAQQTNTVPAASSPRYAPSASSSSYHHLYLPMPGSNLVNAPAPYTPLSLPPTVPYPPQQPSSFQQPVPFGHHHTAIGIQGTQLAQPPSIGSYTYGPHSNTLSIITPSHHPGVVDQHTERTHAVHRNIGFEQNLNPTFAHSTMSP